MASRLINVAGNPNLARCPSSGAIININKDEIEKSRALKSARQNKDKEFRELRQDVNDLKELLNKLVEKL
jgi:predicted mannosyl-3-phosphoglycerate phosphatase (HAD superfamily)|tara:strand:+ start:2093 stop:2302 length:210 start_codon:yes stop_codon:yes gene_type:complete